MITVLNGFFAAFDTSAEFEELALRYKCHSALEECHGCETPGNHQFSIDESPAFNGGYLAIVVQPKDSKHCAFIGWVPYSDDIADALIALKIKNT